MSVFLLLPGAWHGGWAYNKVIHSLTLLGHQAHALTLRGLEPVIKNYSRPIRLEDHIQQVNSYITNNNLRNVILCGHSYGGMVISGAEYFITQRLSAMVYLDAFVPDNGDNVFSLASQQFRFHCQNNITENECVLPLPHMRDDRCVPHPLNTLLDQHKHIDFSKKYKQYYLYLSGWNNTTFKPFFDKYRKMDNWLCTEQPFEHNILSEHPDFLVSYLDDIAQQN